MSDDFLRFCQLCNQAYGEENAQTETEQILRLALEDMTLEFFDRDGEIFCRTLVGPLNDVLDITGCLEALLRGNHLWNGTNGATLSIKDNTVYITDRVVSDYFIDIETVEEYIDEFAHFALLWRQRMELYKSSPLATMEV